jgi:isopentenyl diphosphate isomerase/L-lactate dehydrogenase-like FMN-dependent dehydrogenase
LRIDALNYQELRAAAKARLPRGVFEYIDRGTEDETSLAHNRQAFERLRVQPRILTTAPAVSTAIELFGRTLASPIIVAPTAFAGLVWYKGEIELARAAAAAGIAFCAATEAITAVGEIAAQAPGNLWFQLYLWESEALAAALIEQARAAGIDTLVLTVDTPVYANREFNARNGMGMPFRHSLRGTMDTLMRPRWLAQVLGRYLVGEGAPTFANYPPAYRQTILGGGAKTGLAHRKGLSWEHVREVRNAWPGTLLLKGVLRPEDALLAADHGVDGIVVSNHGGRNLDSAVSPMDVLGRIVDAAGDRLVVLADSGIQRGSDVFKALALGARAVMVGRMPLYGLAAAGEAGGLHAIELLHRELAITLSMCGAGKIEDITRDLLHAP